jgi:hypothetical protein
MKTDLHGINGLIPILNMSFQAKQMKMATLARRIAELRAQLTKLDRPKSFDPMSVATRMGADVLWETWVQDRKALIMRELALALRDREAQRSVLIAALSKLEAAKQVQTRTAVQAKQLVERRSNW